MAQTTYTPSGRGPELIGVFAFFMALTTFTFVLRVYVRATLVKAFGLDDWTAALGWLLFSFHGGFAIAGVYHGTGQHANLIRPQTELPIGLKWWWLCEPIYVTSNMAVKLSISLMLLRFVFERSHKLLIYVVTVILQIYSVVFFFLFVFQCTPSSYFWTRSQGMTGGRCMDAQIIIKATYVYSGIAVLYDWTMALLPWFVVRKLQMNMRTKLLCAFILALGSIASVATIVRIPYISTLGNSADFLYSTTDVALWSCCETGLSITASCAATLKPLFREFLSHSRLFGGTSRAGPIPLTHDENLRKAAKQRYVRTLDMDIESTRDGTQDRDWVTTSKTTTVSVQETT